MELPGTGATDEQCLAAKESRLQHGPPGVKPEVLFDRPQLCTIPALGRRIDWDGPGVRGPVDCRTGSGGLSYRSSLQIRLETISKLNGQPWDGGNPPFAKGETLRKSRFEIVSYFFVPSGR